MGSATSGFARTVSGSGTDPPRGGEMVESTLSARSGASASLVGQVTIKLPYRSAKAASGSVRLLCLGSARLMRMVLHSGRSSFTQNLGKVYGLYTLGFLVFFGLMAILEQMGASARTIGILFLLFTIVIYAVIGFLSRTMQVDAYYVAGREVRWRDGAAVATVLASGGYPGSYEKGSRIGGYNGTARI